MRGHKNLKSQGNEMYRDHQSDKRNLRVNKYYITEIWKNEKPTLFCTRDPFHDHKVLYKIVLYRVDFLNNYGLKLFYLYFNQFIFSTY